MNAAARLALALVLAASGALAQTPTYEPAFGQGGKDVVWVPTSDALVEKMLDMARVTSKDFVMDLGSGDGRTVIAAARRGARALGIEYEAGMVELSRVNAAQAGVAVRAEFRKADLFETDFSEATVITMFLLPSINVKLRPAILELKPGTRIVSNTFGMDEWMPDETATMAPETGCDNWCTAHLWIVPAKVAGKHALPIGELELKQKFQMLSGTLHAGGTNYALEGRVRGDEVTIRAGGREYRGRMSGGKLALQ
ncbi:MAG: class I SAM-dependent methyltransferase [Burkholderiales bacterium]